MPIMLFLILILIFVILLVLVTNIVIVPQSMVYVVERLGSYSETWSAGLHVKIPFLERVAKKVSLKEQVADFPPQPVITRDNVTMQIDTVVFFQVMDAKLYTYGVNQPIAAIESLSATTLRNIIGEMELDHTLTSRDTINSKITAILDEVFWASLGLEFPVNTLISFPCAIINNFLPYADRRYLAGSVTKSACSLFLYCDGSADQHGYAWGFSIKLHRSGTLCGYPQPL